MMKMTPGTIKVLIMAGGTGGHVFPALCIAEHLQAKGIEVEWLGTRSGLEASVIPKASIPIHYISIRGLRGSSVWKKLTAPVSILMAVIQSLVKLLSIKPNCVLGMGGFVTGPGGIAAWLLRRKLVIHEQNAIAGFTNQLLFPFAFTVMEAFPGAFERKQKLTFNPLLKQFIKSGKAIHVGNPLRADIAAVPEPEQRLQGRSGVLNILVIGGSLGAVAINELIPRMLVLMPEDRRPNIFHQCGNCNHEETEKFYREHNLESGASLRIEKFIDDMAAAYCWADLVVCRAGALTVAELAGAGVASILVPFPFAVDDHQTENARYLANAGAAVLIQQQDLTAESLKSIVENYTGDRKALLACAMAARNLAQPRATELASTLCIEACHV
ncbi:MAG: undecaprenyldiphospho-muramoylpentapeptide beta-N-acetylglucosaminyltransferase [Pseudohongiellaceae bacterium]